MKSHYILQDSCISCERCFNTCPVKAISGELKEGFAINQEKCIKCGKCKEVCHFNAITEK